MRWLIISLATVSSFEAAAGPTLADARAKLRRAQVDRFARALQASAEDCTAELRSSLNQVFLRAPAYAARYPLQPWRMTSLKRARQLADDFAQALVDLAHLPAEGRGYARARAVEALIDVARIAGANRGAPRDRLPELRLLTLPMCATWTYTAASQPTAGTLAAAAFITGTYAAAEGFRHNFIRAERVRDEAAWAPTATAELVYQEFGRRVLEREPDLPGLADASAAEVFWWAIDLLRVGRREVIDVCDVLLTRGR